MTLKFRPLRGSRSSPKTVPKTTPGSPTLSSIGRHHDHHFHAADSAHRRPSGEFKTDTVAETGGGCGNNSGGFSGGNSGGNDGDGNYFEDDNVWGNGGNGGGGIVAVGGCVAALSAGESAKQELSKTLWKMLSGGIVYASALMISDVFIQILVEKRKEIDLTRLCKRGMLGLFLKGPLSALFFKFNEVFFPGKTPPTMLKKLAVDLGPWSWFNNCLFLTSVALLEGYELKQAIETVQERFIGLQLSAYRLWPAASTINYLFVPPQARVVFVGSVSVLWSLILCRAAVGV